MFKRTVGTKKRKCKKLHKETINPYNDSCRMLSALDERLNDIERRGRSRKKKRSPPLRPMLKRAASTPSKIPYSFDHRSSSSDYQHKSVRFQNHPYSCHVSGLSPPPCQGRDSCKYTPVPRNLGSIQTSAGDTISSSNQHYLHDSTGNFGGYSKSLNNNYACANSAPSFKLYPTETPVSKYCYSDYDKAGEPKNWKLALKLDELMLKYSEYNTPTSKPFKAKGSPYPISAMDAKHSYSEIGRNSNSSWKQDTSGMSRAPYTSPYKDYYSNTPSFSKYASFYGDNLGMTPNPSAASAGFNPYGSASFRSDAYKSFNDNRSAYLNDSSDWNSSKVIPSEIDVRSKRSTSLKQHLENGLKRSSYGLDSSNNTFSSSSNASSKYGDDLKCMPGGTLSYDISKLKGELFSSGSLLNSQGNESTRVSAMLSEYQRMDYYRKTMQNQRQKNLELLERYVFGTPKNKSNEFLCNKNDNRMNLDVISTGSTLDEKIFESLKKKYDPAPSSILSGKYKIMNNSRSSDNLPYTARSRSLSSGALDHRGLTGARSVLDVSMDRFPKTNKYLSRGTSADDIRSLYVPSVETTFKEHASRRCKTPEDYTVKSQLPQSMSREYRRRSPSIDPDQATQCFSLYSYGSNKNRNYSPIGNKKDFPDTSNRDSVGLYSSGSSKTKISTHSDYSNSVSRDVSNTKTSGLSNNYSSDYQSMYKYGSKDDKTSFSKNLNDTNNWSSKSPLTQPGSKKSEALSPSFYLGGGRTTKDYSANAKQESIMKKMELPCDSSDYFSVNRGSKNAENSPRKGAGGSSSGIIEEKFISSNIASKIPPVSYSCKHVINLCLDDETNRLKNINSLIKKTANLGNTSNNHCVSENEESSLTDLQCNL
ncbi:hypothetical protein BgiMline_021799 [Biomphalaria glabrata]|nr:hypothetical protein BgiMline_028371 [Biomphalaria glabrata]KAI8761744.1 hypothetical protein BgiBS90_030776 [Biomphalaria glabrata]